MSTSQKHGHAAARPMKQGRGMGDIGYPYWFQFQFRLDFPSARMARCTANQSCTYPAIMGHICRLHWMDAASPSSVTRPQSGHSWIRSTAKMMDVKALTQFWKLWHRRAKFVMAMTGVKGAFHPKTKLSDEEVQQIRKLIAQRFHNCKEIGEMYGVSAALVSLISTGDYRMSGAEDLGWTHEDRAACSRRVAKERCEKWQRENGARMKARAERVKAMRDEGKPWREIEKIIGIKYPALLKQYHETYNIPMADHRQAGLKRKRLSGGDQFRVNPTKSTADVG